MYDTAIIGAGPAGLSAAMNLKLHNRNIAVFGAGIISDKLEKAEKIANYPGVPMASGSELNRILLSQSRELGIEIIDKKLTNIMPNGESFMLLAENDFYEARTVIFAIGATSPKGIEGERDLLGSGVSYCATCDGFLYKGKTIAVYCQSKHFEHECEYLAGLADKLYLYAAYDDCNIHRDNVVMLSSPIVKFSGEGRLSSIKLYNKTELEVQGAFVLRNSVAPATILSGLEMNGAHILVDRAMKTNIKGVFAAGDCTGRPYQLAKAVGEGNVAAHSALELL